MEAQATATATATVKEALAALYHHPDDAIRTAADRWLQEFQHTLDAWQVADSLLHDESSNLETLIFCSQTLRSKVQRDFEELPSEAFRSLQDSLYVLLKKFNKGPQKVRTQICIAIAALAVHVPVEDWGAGGVVNWLSDEMKAHPEFIPGFLELLIVLPQETSSYKIAARPERRRQFEIDLCSSANVAIDLLTACMAIDQLKEQVLEGFSSWLRFCHGISASELASHPLVHLALSSLNSDQFLEAAVNVTSELIHATVSHGAGTMAEQMPLIQILVPHIMGLKEQLKDPSKDEEDVKAIARLYADMGESYVDLIATGSDDSIQIVNALLEVTSLLEFAISSMTFNFWHCLKRNLIRRDSYVSYGSEVTVEAEKNRRLQIFCPKFETLVSLVSFRVEYPEDYHTFSEEDRRDFRHVRYAVSDVLLDATEVLGGDSTLKLLSTKLAQAYGSCNNEQNPKWQPVEATLFCIQAIARSVSIEEREILPQVMSLLPCLPQHEQLLQTVCLTIGAFSKWIDAAPAELSILPPLVDILNKGMSTSEDTAAAASMAFKYICEDCRTKFSGSLDGLFQIYHIAISGVGGYKVSSEDSLHLVEALSVIITTLPPESASRALELICQPVINPLQEFIQQGDQVLQRVPARHLTVHIDRLSSIFSNVKQPEVVAEAVYRYWPTLKSIFDQRAWDTRTMESICRSCKFAVRTCGRFMGMTIGAMLEEIQTLYQQHKQSCFLYLSSEVIKIFGSDPSCAGYLTSLIQILFSHTVQLLRMIQDFTARPDIADDCYLLASRCIRYCPDLFIPTKMFQSLVDCAMAGITIQHREACKSILSFLSDVIDLPNTSDGGQYREVINTIILQRGTTLTRIMIAALTGALPSGRLEEKPERINMAGPSDALKPERFAGGENFKRWQTRVKFWLMSLRIWWVISPVLPLTEEQDRNFESDNSTCVGCILTLLSDQLYDIHMHHEVARDLWETLDRMYTESDAGRELYVNEQYHEYKMVDDRSVVEQAHEIQLLVGELAHFDCVLPNKFVVGGIIAKLPPTWSFATALKHKKEAMTVESLIATLDVEEKARSKDVPRSGPMDSGTSNANVVEGKSGGKNKNKTNWKPKAKQNTDFKKKKKNLADLTCFVCGESGHIARKCRNRKGKKGDGQKTANVAIADAGNSGLPTVAPS